MSRRRSIVQVTLWNSPYLGNFMLSQLALARCVRAQLGLGTHFVLADGAQKQSWLEALDAAGTTWSILPSARRRWRAHLAGVVKGHDAALLHTHFTAADIPAARVAKAAGVPCVWHVRTGFNGYPLRQRLKDAFKMQIVARRHVAKIVAVSPWLGELMHRRGAPGELVSVLPNPIVIERFANLPARQRARERFGLSAEATVVLGLGWWPRVKGADVLLDAVGTLAGLHPEAQLLLVGEGKMRALVAKRLPMRPAWLRLSGFVEDSAWLFAAADVFVSASRHEGQSSAIGEALACALPVLMSDIEGTARWAPSPGVEVFASEDAAALAAQLERLLALTPQERAAAGQENRRWIERHAGLESWCGQLCGMYRTLLDGGERTACVEGSGSHESSGGGGSGSGEGSGGDPPGERAPQDGEVLGGQLAQGE